MTIQKIIGYVLIVLGAAIEVLTVLIWAGLIPTPPQGLTVGTATFWDILLALLQSAPWPAVVGLLMIYAGLKMVEVPLPF